MDPAGADISTIADLHDLYRRTHTENPKRFLGHTTKLYVEPIARLIAETRAESLLDYGSGKGTQYLGDRRVHEKWGGLLPWCYDPGVIGLAERPARTFHGVICLDVLEHVPEHLLGAVIADVFSFAERFILFGIATVPSHKSLADGRLAHVTVRPLEWWTSMIANVHGQMSLVPTLWEAWFTDESKIARKG